MRVDDTRDTGDADVLGSADETEEIRADIEQTRSEMSETIEALQERLSPTALKEQAVDQFQDVREHVKEQVREQIQEAKAAVREATIGKVENMVHTASNTAQDARYTVMDTIRQNPIPAAMVGLGLAWMFMNRSSTPSRRSTNDYARVGYSGDQTYYARQPYAGGSSYYGNPSYYEEQRGSGGVVRQGQQAVSNVASRAQDTASNIAGTAGNVASNIADTAGNVASNIADTAGNVVDQAQETVGNLAGQAQYRVQRVEDRFQETLYQNPLAVGAVALALGTAVGLALPATRREHELMGEARDNLVEKVQGAAQDTMEKAQRVAEQVMDTAQSTVKEAAQNEGLTKG